MSKTKTSVVPLHQLVLHQPADTFALLVEKTAGTTRDGKPYFACTFRDKVRSLAARIWADSPCFEDAHQWNVGDYLRIHGVYTEHERYGPQITPLVARPISEADRAEGFVESDFLDRSRFDSEKMFAELKEVLSTEIAHEPLRKLVVGLLEAHAEVLRRLPAHKDRFFPFPGGWLEHVLGVTRNCLLLTDRYRAHYSELKPPLNRDLVLAGAALHDIGRVVEFRQPLTPGQKVERSVEGELFTHTLLGRDLIRDAAKQIEGLDAEWLLLLEHIVMTHLELPSWGSPRLPAIPEVLILHHADDLDAKLEMYVRNLTRDTNDGPFTAYDPTLGKPLLKRRNL